MQFINDGVGLGQRNWPRDVVVVQKLLNMNLGRINRLRIHPLHPLSPNGLFDAPTQILLQAYCAWGGYSAVPVVFAPLARVPKPPVQAVMPLSRGPMRRRVSGVSPGELARMHPALRGLVTGALALQGQYAVWPQDAALRALDVGSIATWPMFKALCRMRQSRSLLSVLLAMAPTIRQNEKASPDQLADSVALAMQMAEITTPMRKAAFLAQIAAESDGFKALREYRSGTEYEGRADLGNVLPNDGVRFAGRGYIQLTGRANYTLAWQQLGLPLSHNDLLKPLATGAKHAPKSDIEPSDPSYGETLEGAAKLTAWYWTYHKLNDICDQMGKVGTQDAVLLKLSIAINGKNKSTGLPNGWDHRKQYFGAAKHALGSH